MGLGWIGMGRKFAFNVLFDWKAFWASLISATVENAAPDQIVLTFPEAQEDLDETDFSVTVNAEAREITTASWTGPALTLTLAAEVEYGDTVVVTFNTTEGTAGVTNNVPFDWEAYWSSLISATVEDAAPTNVVLTFPTAKTELIDTDFTIGGKTITNAVWEGAILTLTVSVAFKYGDTPVVTFNKTGQTANVTNNVLYTMLLTKTGDGTGVSTIRMESSSDVVVTLGANAKFYSDSAGTLDESSTWTITAGALRTAYLKCTTGTALMTFSNTAGAIKFGSEDGAGWASGTNAAKLTADFSALSFSQLRIEGTSDLTGLPTELTYLRLFGNSIAWTYSGALPTGLTTLYLYGGSIAWTYSGALPTELTYLRLQGNSIAWTYSGALPTELTYLRLQGNSIAWTYSGALPTELEYLYLDGSSIAWTGLDVGNNGNIGTFNLINYRITKMSSADMVTLLTQLTNRTGALPSTITINDYVDYASPPAEVVNAVNALKVAKSITTVNLGA